MSGDICIHGHFYQPPRENPWLEFVEIEDGAYPFHDWNERITAECYAPNASSRILDSEKRIVDITNNYSKISFNFGPTLMSWLEVHEPEVYAAILFADNKSKQSFSGHGSAIAQGYNHIILPLASSRDKKTQVLWGIRDFIHRFQRRPEGMWLPETAVDHETLEILARQGIAFTILSPFQAQRVKKAGEFSWTDVKGGKIDTSVPYICRLPHGQSITLFFYEQGITQDIAFGKLLENGEKFAERMLRQVGSREKKYGLLNLATDGETYGHHHRFADMALAYALYRIENQPLARITVYGEYLTLHPAVNEVEIIENSSWSCTHGVERWRSDCGCCTGGTTIVAEPSGINHGNAKPEIPISPPCHIGWNQKWRAPLREAMDWLRDNLGPLYEKECSRYLTDPWQARDDYIEVILDRSPDNVGKFFREHSVRDLNEKEKVLVLKLLEMQRNALLMYTSCGWFFDDISGIESVQVMMYACRAMQLAREVNGVDFESGYKEILKNAESNISGYQNGAWIYEKFVQTAIIDLTRVGFHYAVSSLVEEFPETVQVNNYTIKREEYQKTETGALKLATGRAYLRSDITFEETTLMFAVLHLGDHNFMGGTCIVPCDEEFLRMQSELAEAFARSDIQDLILIMGRHFGAHSYTIWHLFKDGQRKVLRQVLALTLSDLETTFRRIYKQYFPLLKAMKEIGIPPPSAIEFPVRYILNEDLRHLLEEDSLDLNRLTVIVREMQNGNFPPDIPALSFAAGHMVNRLIKNLSAYPDDISLMERVNAIFLALEPLHLNYDLWECQNHFFWIGRQKSEEMRKKSMGDMNAKKWLDSYEALGFWLGVKSP